MRSGSVGISRSPVATIVRSRTGCASAQQRHGMAVAHRVRSYRAWIGSWLAGQVDDCGKRWQGECERVRLAVDRHRLRMRLALPHTRAAVARIVAIDRPLPAALARHADAVVVQRMRREVTHYQRRTRAFGEAKPGEHAVAGVVADRPAEAARVAIPGV